MSQIELRFTDNKISSRGGLSILKKMLAQSGFIFHLESLPLPVQGSIRYYDLVQLFNLIFRIILTVLLIKLTL